jgi:hypothetical protein
MKVNFWFLFEPNLILKELKSFFINCMIWDVHVLLWLCEISSFKFHSNDNLMK